MADEKNVSSESIELPAGMISALNGTGEDTVPDVNMGAGGMMDLDVHVGISMPQLRIIEQPKSRGFRFRYGCEGPSHGGLPGEHSQKGKKSYPSVEIINYKGDARIVVSLVTDEEVPKPHAHSLVGKHCCNGICTVQVGPKDLTACFQNLGIQHVTRKEVIPVLKKRILEHQKVYNALIGTTPVHQIAEDEAEKRAKNMAKDMDLSRVKLCFQAYLKDQDGRFTHALAPVLSNVVYDSKAPNATTLKICRMDRSSGSASGGEEVYLLCDKVQKDDIEVRFFEVNSKGELTWERSADFGPTDVHRQYAIVFKTPPYRDGNIEKPVSVQVQLRRKSDSEVSDPKPFTFHPPIKDKEGILRKRVKPLPNFDQGSGPGSDGPGGRGFTMGSLNLHGMTPRAFGNPGLLGMGMQRNPGGPHMQQQQQQVTNNHIQGSPTTIQGPHSQNHIQGPATTIQGPHGQIHQPMVTHPEMVHGANSQPRAQIVQGAVSQPNMQMFHGASSQHRPQMGHVPNSQPQMFAQHRQFQQQQQQNQMQELMRQQFQQQQQQWSPEQNGLNGDSMDDMTSDLKPRGTSRTQTQIKQEHEDSDDSIGSVELDAPTVLNNRFGIRGFGGIIEADGAGSHKYHRDNDMGLGLDFSGEIEADACAVHVITSGYESDDEIDTVKLGGYDRDGSRMDRKEGLEPDVRKDSRTEQAVQTDTPEMDYEAKIWEMGEVFSRCLQEYGRTGDNRIIIQAHRHLCAVDDENGDTPLHLAVIHKQPEALQALLSVILTIKGQKIINQKNKLNQTPLHLAVITEQPEMVTMLMKCGSDPNILDQNGFNALHHAVDYGVKSVIPTLLEGPPGKPVVPLIKADPDALNLDGYSALHMAVEKKDTAAARALIKSGANKDIPDGKSGRAPLHYAVMAEDFNMLSYLVADARADIHAEDYVGNTPLHIASAYDLSAVAALLIAAGADPESRNGESSGDSDIDEGCEVSEGEEDERTGSSALDFAQSDKMRNILRGETYAPSVALEGWNKSRQQSGNASAMSTAVSTENSSFLTERLRVESQLDNRNKQEGDISSLPREYMRSLVKRLDVTHPLANDWRAVADHLGMGNMINHLRMFDSPTQVLLDQYALMDGTLAELHQVMESLGRKDVINILNEAFTHMNAESKDPSLDNGVAQIAV